MAKRQDSTQGLFETVFAPEDLTRVRAEMDDAEFPIVDIEETDYRCPRCGFEWNGRPRPGSNPTTKESS